MRKSGLMKTIANELLQNGGSKENIIYLDLDKSEGLKIRSADKLEKLIELKN